MTKTQCQTCKGSGYFGRIGVHEVLSKKNILSISASYLSMRDAGLIHMQSGLINQVALDNEIGTWH
jgi:type II secretory ATPase GspE/PulE/Tfp pilus assembly ATPase PilB-like protein